MSISLLHIPSVNKSNLPCSLCETLRCFDVWRWKCFEMKYSFFFFFSWLNYVCVHCQTENCCSCEGCFKRTFLPVAQNTLPPYYRDCLAHIHMQPYGNIKWRECTPQWTCWISVSVSCSWLITWRLGWLFLTHLPCHASFLVETLFLSYGQKVYLYTLFFYLKQWYNEMVLWIMSRW